MNRPPTSAPDLVWRNAGKPKHKYAEEKYEGVCATCAAPIEVGVSAEQINNPTFSNHSEFFKFGTHVCRACAWLYGDPKRTHRNVLAVGDELWWPMISVENAQKQGRTSWRDLLLAVDLWSDPAFGSEAELPPDAPICGVLTTDPKPRNWPRMRLSTVRAPMLYVYAPAFDVSSLVSIDLSILGEIMDLIAEAQELGFARYIRRGGKN